MNILALDTSTAALSIALQSGDSILSRHEILPGQHANLILSWIEEMFAKANLSQSSLDAIAVGCGPGGFTGVRIGMSVVQGLAFAWDLPVVLVSSLSAIAQWVVDQESVSDVMVAQDARMGQVYIGAYQKNPKGFVEAVIEDGLSDPIDVLLGEKNSWRLAGDAWLVYPELQSIQLSHALSVCHHPHALAVLKLGNELCHQGKTVSAEEALPVYLRGKEAWKKKPIV
jgi:tRNA threonylcarbamoyladenosine biosynthesis protein TsaB